MDDEASAEAFYAFLDAHRNAPVTIRAGKRAFEMLRTMPTHGGSWPWGYVDVYRSAVIEPDDVVVEVTQREYARRVFCFSVGIGRA